MKIIRGNELEYSPASHENPSDPGCLKKVLATKDNFIFGQVQMANWTTMPIGKSFRRHYHEDLQECFVIIAGVVEVEVDNQQAMLSAGDAIIIEPMEIHRMTNIGNIEAKYMVFGIASGNDGKTVVVE